MSANVLFDDVADIIAEVLPNKDANITPEASLEDHLGVDSLAMIEISVALEERFGFVAPDAALPEELGIITVADLVAFVEKQCDAKGAEQ